MISISHFLNSIFSHSHILRHQITDLFYSNRSITYSGLESSSNFISFTQRHQSDQTIIHYLMLIDYHLLRTRIKFKFHLIYSKASIRPNNYSLLAANWLSLTQSLNQIKISFHLPKDINQTKKLFNFIVISELNSIYRQSHFLNSNKLHSVRYVSYWFNWIKFHFNQSIKFNDSFSLLFLNWILSAGRVTFWILINCIQLNSSVTSSIESSWTINFFNVL